jgi:tetratricopeptide (TPR) repeat protein
MARSEIFGRLLKAAIGSIVAHEGTTAPVIEDELGAHLGVSAASIQRYKAGHIPPEASAVAYLATMAVTRGFLNRAWLVAFLRAAAYPSSEALIDQLCPTAPALSSPTSHVYNNLPAPTYARFVPRPQVMADVIDGLQQRTAVTLLVGLGGLGKTSIAREIASLCRDRVCDLPAFDAVVWISDQDHPGSTTLSSVLHEIAYTLDFRALLQHEHDMRQREIERLLRQQRVLLVVDNAETIIDTALLHWLTRLPEPSKALVTSRVLREELRRSCWPVELPRLAADEANLLVEHLLSSSGRHIHHHVPPELHPLLTAAGGNPKALKLALGWLKYGGQTVEQVVDTLSAAQGDLFDDLFARTWSLLDDPARQILLVLPLFAGPARRAALSATAEVTEPSAAYALEQLLHFALIDRTGDTHAFRYTLHPLVRAFAHAKLRQQPAFAQAAQARQLTWYADLAATVGYCWDDLTRLNVLDGEHETIGQILRSASPDDPQTARLVRGVDYYYYLRGLWDADTTMSAIRARVAAQAGDEEALRSLAYHIQMLCRQGQLDEAARRLPELMARAECTQLTDDMSFEMGYTHALYAMACGNDADAIVQWERLLPVSQRVSVRAFAVNRGWLAICRYRQGARNEARTLWTAALADSEAGGFLRGVVSSKIGLARLQLDEGESDAAYALLKEVRQIATSYGDRSALAEIDSLTARYYSLQGDDQAARAALAAAQDTWQRLGLTSGLMAVS